MGLKLLAESDKMIIIITSYNLVTALRETEERVKELSWFDDFISKQWQDELLARIRSLLKIKDYNDLRSNYQKNWSASK